MALPPLRDYQRSALAHCLDVLRANLAAKKPCRLMIASPTGSGKSVMELSLAEALRALLGPGWVVTPRIEIAAGMLEKIGVDISEMGETRLIAACWDRGISTPIRLRNELLAGREAAPNWLIFDEAHHHNAESWCQIDLMSGGVPAFGFTASPFRGTPQGTDAFRKIWGEPRWAITYPEAARRGFIAVPQCRVSPIMDDDAVTITNGEFVVSQLNTAFTAGFPAALSLMRPWFDGTNWDRPTVISVPSRQCATMLAGAMLTQSLPCEVITGETGLTSRRYTFAETLARKVALIQINVVGEGVDLPLRRLLDLSPIMSPVKWLQLLGRIFRPVAAGEPAPEYVCLAEDTPVLTDRGWVPVQDVRSNDSLWDGYEWVAHDGVVCNGFRDVVNVCGVRMTEDHDVLTDDGWVPAWGVRAYMESMYRSPTDPACAKKLLTQSAGVRFRGLAGLPIMEDGVFRCPPPGSPTAGRFLNIWSGWLDGTTPTLPLIELTTILDMNRAIYVSQLGGSNGLTNARMNGNAPGESMTGFAPALTASNSAASKLRESRQCSASRNHSSLKSVRVYDILNAGPRHRFQAGPLIVSNCTNRNLLRHAYLLEGLVPSGAIKEAQAAFNGPGKRAGIRAIGLEGLGRFKAAELPLADGTTGLMYQLSTLDGNRVTQFAAMVRPNNATPLWAKRENLRDNGQTVAYGRWEVCDTPPTDFAGFASCPPALLSEKQKAWWARSAAAFGLDPNAEVTRKNFAALPILADLRKANR